MGCDAMLVLLLLLLAWLPACVTVVSFPLLQPPLQVPLHVPVHVHVTAHVHVPQSLPVAVFFCGCDFIFSATDRLLTHVLAWPALPLNLNPPPASYQLSLFCFASFAA